MEKPIISLWGFGPSYRKRVKLNILEAINSGYDNTMDYIVLTDYPEDFIEFAEQTGKIKAIVDINEVRKEHDWSKEVEFIPPSATDEVAYGREYNEALTNRKLFSYSLHRFSFPTFAKLGYNKIVFMDGDVKIRYDKIINGELTEEQFWAEFDTPANSMKGCVYEKIQTEADPDDHRKLLFKWSNALGTSQSLGALSVSSIVLNELYNQKFIYRTPIITELEITEGPFRYYHFESSEKVQEYFETWNESIKICFTQPFLMQYQQCGGYMTCDYIPIGVTNIFHNMQVLNFPNTVYARQIHYTDRYFLPMPGGAPGLGTPFIPGKTEEDFLKKNKKLKKIMEQRNAWPHTEPY